MAKRSNTWESIDLLVEPLIITDKIIQSTCSFIESKLKEGLNNFILSVCLLVDWSIIDSESTTKGETRNYKLTIFKILLFAQQTITQIWILP